LISHAPDQQIGIGRPRQRSARRERTAAAVRVTDVELDCCRHGRPALLGTVVEDVRALAAEQLRYYRARAGEYDTSLGYGTPAVRDQYSSILDWLGPSGRTLELACGTGLWTELLAERVFSVTAVDGAPEMVELARGRRGAGTVEFVVADLLSWAPTQRYDTIFFAFWLSHVPPVAFGTFWAKVRSALAPGGQVLFVDTGPAEANYEQYVDGVETPLVERTVRSGDRFRVVKVLHDPRNLEAALGGLGFSARVRSVDAPGTFSDSTLLMGRAEIANDAVHRGT
jgi:demethylmenaquinone methyltransferase/2-methoxy-6-polyprenyl-1,4-benzoquinol methylase